MKTKIAITALIIISLYSIVNLPLHGGEVKIFLNRNKMGDPIRGIAISVFTNSPYVHAGIIVDDTVIEIGREDIVTREYPNGLENAVEISTGIKVSKEIMIERMKESYQGYIDMKNLFKIISNKVLGTDFDVDGHTCSSIVAKMLGVENYETVVPADFARLDELLEENKSLPNWINMNKWEENNGKL